MLRCKEVVELVASDAWREPPVARRFAVVLHLAMCRHCRAYVRHLRQVAAAVRRLYGRVALDRAAAQRITAAVRAAAERAQPRGSPEGA